MVRSMAKIGRPTKYDDSMPAKVYAYIAKCKANPMGETREGLEIPTLPVLAELSSILKVNKDTIVEWRKRYDLFSDACSELVAMQETILVQSGLAGSFNSTIAARLLGANHGMADKKDVTTNGKDLPAFSITLSETVEDDG
jgi:hypothetical protein